MLDKQLILKKKDKSKKGSIDESIKPLINLINLRLEFCTTCSC